MSAKENRRLATISYLRMQERAARKRWIAALAEGRVVEYTAHTGHRVLMSCLTHADVDAYLKANPGSKLHTGFVPA